MYSIFSLIFPLDEGMTQVAVLSAETLTHGNHDREKTNLKHSLQLVLRKAVRFSQHGMN